QRGVGMKYSPLCAAALPMKRYLSHSLIASFTLLGALACGSEAPNDTETPPLGSAPETPGLPGQPTGMSPEPSSPTTPPNTPPLVPGVPAPGHVDDKGPKLTSCETSAVGSPVLRALTRSEFENSINDIFPGVAGKWTNGLPSNLVSGSGFDNDVTAQIGEQTAERLLNT